MRKVIIKVRKEKKSFQVGDYKKTFGGLVCPSVPVGGE